MKAGPTDVLIIDDDPQMCAMVRSVLTGNGLTCTTTTDPREAKELLDSRKFAVMVADIFMPGASGLDLLSHVKEVMPDCRVLLITGLSSVDKITEALRLGAYDYLCKPFDVDQLVETIYKALSDTRPDRHLPTKAARALDLQFQRKQAALDSILALVHAVEAKDPYTRWHSEQVAHYAIHLARHLQLSKETVESIRIAALVHDIGKIGVPDHILTKPGPLTEQEFRYVRRHPALGADILRDIRMFAGQALLVRHHHERWDGTGYPDGLAGEQIPRGARLLNIADAMDAMLMVRTYKQRYPVLRMLDELTRCAGTQFDPELAAAAVEWSLANPDELIVADLAYPKRRQPLHEEVFSPQSEGPAAQAG